MISLLTAGIVVIVTVIAIFATVMAALSSPYRQRWTSRVFAGGATAYMLTCLCITTRAHLPRSFLYEHQTLSRILSSSITVLNNSSVFLVLLGISLYFVAEEDKTAESSRLNRRKISRSARLTLVLGGVALLVAALQTASSLPFLQSYTHRPLVLMSPAKFNLDGSAVIGVKNFSEEPVYGVVVTFHGYVDNRMTFSPRDPKIHVKSVTPIPAANALERIYTIELNDLPPDNGVVISIRRDETLAMRVFPSNEISYPFTEPYAVRAWHAKGPIPTTADVRVVTVAGEYGVNQTVIGTWQIK